MSTSPGLTAWRPRALAERLRRSAETARAEVAITAREKRHLAFRASRLLARRLYGQPHVRNALVYPPIGSPARLADVVNRLSWYVAGANLDTAVAVSPELWAARPGELSALSAPAAQHRYLEAPPPRVRLTPDGEALLEMTDLLLLHDWRAVTSLPPRCLARAEIVDPEYFDITESSTWQELHYLSLPPEARGVLLERSRQVYAELSARCDGAHQAYVFGTGPSLDSVRAMRLAPGSLRIACNSVVKSDELMDHLAPQLLTFADPVFHFGVSTYAHELRVHLARAAERHPFVVMVPEHQAPLLLHHLPVLRGRLIGMPVVPRPRPHWPTVGAFSVSGTENVMTLFMLPMATALARKVAIAGADGRAADETYFWRHAESAQLGGMMPDAFATHPSFFRDRRYGRYYAEHCAAMARLLAAGRRRGVTYQALTPSRIPALASLRPEAADRDGAGPRRAAP